MKVKLVKEGRNPIERNKIDYDTNKAHWDYRGWKLAEDKPEEKPKKKKSKK